jgi:hypothetical protein
VAPAAHAESRAPAVAFVTGASLFFAGFMVGGVLVATSHTDDSQNTAGWLTMEAGFALAPLASHALTGEWTRALVFSAVPSASLAGSAALLAIRPETIQNGDLEDQRVIWSLFGAGLISSLVGIVDSAFADKRAAASGKHPIAFAPIIGPAQIGLGLGAAL